MYNLKTGNFWDSHRIGQQKYINRGDAVLVLLWTDFTHCSSVSIVDFEQLNAGSGVAITDFKLLGNC